MQGWLRNEDEKRLDFYFILFFYFFYSSCFFFFFFFFFFFLARFKASLTARLFMILAVRTPLP